VPRTLVPLKLRRRTRLHRRRRRAILGDLHRHRVVLRQRKPISHARHKHEMLAVYSGRPNISSRPPNFLGAFFLAPQIQLPVIILRVYKSRLLTYLLTYTIWPSAKRNVCYVTTAYIRQERCAMGTAPSSSYTVPNVT